MEIHQLLSARTRQELRNWLSDNHESEKECWVRVNRSKTPDHDMISYLDAVEEALCFGWIDSTCKKLSSGGVAQRLTPRKPKSPWTELNKARVRRLERLGLMTEAGRLVLPDMNPEHFVIDPEIEQWLRQNTAAYENFKKFPPLYQRVRIDTIQSKKRKPEVFQSRFEKFQAYTIKNQMYGSWNDDGRLPDD